jgi:SanA protein
MLNKDLIIKVLSLFVFILFIGFALIVFIIDRRMSALNAAYIFHDIEKTPPKSAALVLGTVKYAHGRINKFYAYRIDAAAELFKSGKVKAIVVSGDNSRKGYDEPTDMKNDLIGRGVPERYITADYAGFRTYDSIIRAKAIFGLDDYIIVSQPSHCERALFIARAKGHNAIAFSAQDVGGVYGKKIRLREALARFRAALDVNVLHTQPKFLGSQEKVVYRQS